MSLKSRDLFSPTWVGQIPVANRIVMAPMTRGRAGESRVPNSLMAHYYVQRASAGLIISEATAISEQAFGWNGSPAIITETQIKGWQTITDSVHAAGGRMVLQLWHCGRASHSSFHPVAGLPVAPSAIAIQGDSIHTPSGKQPYEIPRSLEASEISSIVQDYQTAAKHALAAGFDGVEIHGANGYLLDQFLQSKSNHRTDSYGGSVENRMRFLLDVVDSVTAVWGTDRVGVRISPNGIFNDMGDCDPRRLFLAVADQLNRRKIAYLHVMDGLGFGFHGNGEPMLIDEFRPCFHGTILCNVGYTKESGQAALERGVTDLVAYGRPFITNPDLVQRFRQNNPLAPFDDMSQWYTADDRCYTDYPTYAESLVTTCHG
jgi:N-ethylmaleimide reductase